MRGVFFGDVVGDRALRALASEGKGLKRRYDLDFMAVNVENASGGFGVRGEQCDLLFEGGFDVLTSGNHIWDDARVFECIEEEERLLRPINLPEGTPGRGWKVYELGCGRKVGVVNAIGRLHMGFMSDNPYAATSKALEMIGDMGKGGEVAAILLDMHGESNTEKDVMGRWLDGRVSAVFGTHCHAPTADDRILSGGTGYMTDVGMCGDYDSVVGFEGGGLERRFVEQLPSPRSGASGGEPTLCGVLFETDDETGLCMRAEAYRSGGVLKPRAPDF